MSHIERIKRHLKKENAYSLIAAELKEMKAKIATKVIFNVAKDLDADFLEHIFIPAFIKRIFHDKNLYKELIGRIDKHQNLKQLIGEDFGFEILRLLNKAIRKLKLPKIQLDHFQRVIRKIASDSDSPSSLRINAIRLLSNEISMDNIKIIEKLLKTNQIPLVEAAARVIWNWTRKKLPHHDLLRGQAFSKIIKILIMYADRMPGKVLLSPNIVGALASVKTSKAISTVKNLANYAKTDAQISLLLSCAGDKLDDSSLANLIKKIKKNKYRKGINILGGLVRRYPDCLKNLYEAKKYPEYFFALNVSRRSDYKNWDAHLTSLCKSNNHKIANQARTAAHLLPYDKKLALYRLGAIKNKPISNIKPLIGGSIKNLYAVIIGDQNLGKYISISRISELSQPITTPSSPSSTTGSFPNNPGIGVSRMFAYRGDAIYRDLGAEEKSGGIIKNHWHAGLYMGLEKVGDSLFLKGIHHANPYGTPYKSKYAKVHKFGDEGIIDIQSPTAEVSSELLFAFTELQRYFGVGGIYQLKWRSSYSPPDLVGWQREDIITTAYSFIDKGTGYRWYDMLEPDGDWDGTIEGIDEMRCDGFVEYCYEKNGIRACGGENDDYWNISEPGNEYTDNHEEFHTGDSTTKGETCPKIQSGVKRLDDGTKDSPFVKTETDDRKIDNHFDFFQIEPSHGELPPLILFSFDIKTSSTIFVRITVCKEGGAWEHVIADDLLDERDSLIFETPHGKMNFMEMQQEQGTFWFGRTGEGKDYWGQNGKYSFYLDVIDRGGNYAAYQRTIDITWPEKIFPPNNRVSDDLLFPEYPILNILSWELQGSHSHDNQRCDRFTLKFTWKSDSTQPELHYSVYLDGNLYENMQGISCNAHSGTEEIEIHITVTNNDAYTHEVTIQLDEHPDSKKTINVKLEQPSSIAIPYVHNSEIDYYRQAFPANERIFELISDALDRDSIQDVKYPDGTTPTQDDINSNLDRRVFVFGDSRGSPDQPGAILTGFEIKYKWGYVSNPVKCDFLNKALIEPLSITATLRKTNEPNQPIPNIPPNNHVIFEGFTENDYNNNNSIAFDYEVRDVVGQVINGRLLFSSRSILWIIHPLYDSLWDPDWSNLKDRLHENWKDLLSREIFVNIGGLTDPENIVIRDNFTKFREQFTPRLSSLLVNLSRNQALWISAAKKTVKEYTNFQREIRNELALQKNVGDVNKVLAYQRNKISNLLTTNLIKSFANNMIKNNKSLINTAIKNFIRSQPSWNI